MREFPPIPGYQIQAELGRGGMAVVYQALDTGLGRQVAIKVVGGAGGDLDGHIERLENEARGLAALHHPHIVDLYTFGRTADGALFYVMPLLPGGSLEDWPKPAPEARVVELLDALLDALAHAHASDIVHRDIKPANILFDRNDRPLLADFGAALRRQRDTRLTQHGTAIGSSGYMSPEQARGLEVDARSDLYSTAVLAFELLTGRRPFEGSDDLAIAIAQTEQPVPTLPPALRHWQAFFARALAVRKDERFADAAAMRAGVHALRTRAPARAARGAGKGWAIAAAAVLVAALAYAFWGFSRPAEPVHAPAVEALFAAGKLTPPDGPSVQSELLRARGQDIDRLALDALQARLLERLGADVDAALAADQGDAAAAAIRRWHDAVSALDALAAAPVAAQQAAFSARLDAALAAAVAGYDRAAATTALAVVDAWDGAAPDLRARAEAARALPVVGGRFRDDGEPELVLVASGDGDRPARAVMAAAVDPALYAEFAAASGREAGACAPAAAPAQGCFDVRSADDFARWLGERSGHRWRVPARDELAAVLDHVEDAPAYALTSTCHEVRVAHRRNVASRLRSGVRELFGRGGSAPSTSVRCDGNYALALDDRGGEPVVRDRAAEDTALVLVRDLAATDAGAAGE